MTSEPTLILGAAASWASRQDQLQFQLAFWSPRPLLRFVMPHTGAGRKFPDKTWDSNSNSGRKTKHIHDNVDGRLRRRLVSQLPRRIPMGAVVPVQIALRTSVV